MGSSQEETPPKLSSRVVKDFDGNKIRITDVKRSCTTKLCYKEANDISNQREGCDGGVKECDDDDEELSCHSSASESLGASGYIEMPVEIISIDNRKDIKNQTEAEVIEEVTTLFKPVEYDSQETSMMIGDAPRKKDKIKGYTTMSTHL